MTQEDKELLLKDLCARLPYGVKVSVNYDIITIETKEMGIGTLHDFTYGNVDIKPYLRSMSSMTEEEKQEFSKLAVGTHLFKGPLIPSYDTLDWLNKHHFDYRGLIEKGLALGASEEMYNNKT